MQTQYLKSFELTCPAHFKSCKRMSSSRAPTLIERLKRAVILYGMRCSYVASQARIRAEKSLKDYPARGCPSRQHCACRKYIVGPSIIRLMYLRNNLVVTTVSCTRYSCKLQMRVCSHVHLTFGYSFSLRQWTSQVGIYHLRSLPQDGISKIKKVPKRKT